MRVPPFLLILLVGSVPIILVGLILTVGNVELVAWRPPLAWSDKFGTPNVSGTVGAAGEIDNAVTSVGAGDSGVYAVGYENLPLAENATSGNLFVRSYDLTGNMVWTHDQKSLFFDQFSQISVGIGGVYVVGSVNNSVAVLKFDFNGDQLW